MRVTTIEFPLLAWRARMGWTQAQAAEALGISAGGYRAAEYRNNDTPGFPCNKTLALLAQSLERERTGRDALPVFAAIP